MDAIYLLLLIVLSAATIGFLRTALRPSGSSASKARWAPLRLQYRGPRVSHGAFVVNIIYVLATVIAVVLAGYLCVALLEAGVV